MTSITKRDSSWTMVRPGLYFDLDGNGHIFPDEVIAELSRLYPEVPWSYEDDYDLVVQSVISGLGSKARDIHFIKHEREKN